MLPLPRVGDALLAHYLNCIRPRRDCQFHSAPFIPRHGISSVSHEPGSGNMGNSGQIVGYPGVPVQLKVEFLG
jgi:hypothetical protein